MEAEGVEWRRALQRFQEKEGGPMRTFLIVLSAILVVTAAAYAYLTTRPLEKATATSAGVPEPAIIREIEAALAKYFAADAGGAA